MEISSDCGFLYSVPVRILLFVFQDFTLFIEGQLMRGSEREKENYKCLGRNHGFLIFVIKRRNRIKIRLKVMPTIHVLCPRK